MPAGNVGVAGPEQLTWSWLKASGNRTAAPGAEKTKSSRDLNSGRPRTPGTDHGQAVVAARQEARGDLLHRGVREDGRAARGLGGDDLPLRRIRLHLNREELASRGPGDTLLQHSLTSSSASSFDSLIARLHCVDFPRYTLESEGLEGTRKGATARHNLLHSLPSTGPCDGSCCRCGTASGSSGSSSLTGHPHAYTCRHALEGFLKRRYLLFRTFPVVVGYSVLWTFYGLPQTLSSAWTPQTLKTRYLCTTPTQSSAAKGNCGIVAFAT